MALSFFHRLSIQKKLTLIVMLATSAALLTTAVLFILNDTQDYRKRVVYDLRILAQIFGESCGSSLKFRFMGNREQEVARILSTLEAKPHVLGAAVYDAEGNLFSAYPANRQPSLPLPLTAPPAGHRFVDGRLAISQPIVDRAEKLGSIYLDFDLVEMRQRIWKNCAVVAGALLVSGLLALLITARLQQFISQPILDLARVANAISEKRDYSVRAAKRSEDEVGFLIDCFNGMLEKIEMHEKTLRDVNEQLAKSETRALAATEAKSQFLANMSHELRTPLNAIIGYSELLLEEVDEAGQKQFLPDLEKVRNAAKHQLNLINGILDLSKIEAGKMTLFLETFDVARTVEDVANTVRPLVAAKGNRLEIDLEDGLGTMRADQTKVRQVLFNLLSNAAKFTEKGLVRIQVRRAASNGSRQGAVASRGSAIEFSVSDTGIGIMPEQCGRLFQPFTQAESSTTRKYGGTGLGLALSRRFCEMMGGELTATSEWGKGSTFTALLPVEVTDTTQLRRTPTGPDPALPVDEPGTRRAPILVVDDEPAARDLLYRALTREGYRVQLASSGPEGLALARLVKPAAITLDVMMPGMDGWSVLTVLKADPGTAEIPVIMLTVVDDKNLGFALGAADYLVKPIQWDRLIAVLEKHQTRSPGAEVLVVEDEPDTRDLLRRAAQKEGWHVSVAENGRVALERVAENVPGVILLDLIMPEMDGFTFIEELRRRPECRHVPVVVVTAKDLTDHERQRLNGHVVQVLQKGGHSTRELLDEIHELLCRMALTATSQDAAGVMI